MTIKEVSHTNLTGAGISGGIIASARVTHSTCDRIMKEIHLVCYLVRTVVIRVAERKYP